MILANATVTHAEHPTGDGLSRLNHDELMRLWESQQRLRQGIIALEKASGLPFVVAYRKQHLADGLLEPDDDSI